MASTFQAGVRPGRLEWVAETEEGITPDSPQFNLISDNLESEWGWEPDANTQRLNGTGEITAVGFFNGSETHDTGFTYSLQQWPHASDGSTKDISGDFLQPDTDNSLKTTHTLVGWSEQASGGPNDTGRYIVTVAKGCHPDSLTMPFENEDGTPISTEANWQAEKIRQYDLRQPSSSGSTLTVKNGGTTSVDVTVENYDGTTQETLTVSAGGSSTTVSPFTSLGAVEKASDVDGDVTVEDGSQNVLCTLKGSQAYPAGEGDLGVPTVGSSGSHASEIGTDFIRFIGDTLSIPNVESDVEVISGEMSVETGLGDNPKTGTAGRNIHAAEWSYTLTATLAGSKVSVDSTRSYLTEQTGTVSWEADEGTVDFNGAFIQSPGEYTKGAGSGKLQMDNEWSAETITINTT